MNKQMNCEMYEVCGNEAVAFTADDVPVCDDCYQKKEEQRTESVHICGLTEKEKRDPELARALKKMIEAGKRYLANRYV